MGTLTFTHTSTGVEPKPGLIESYVIQNWTGTFNFTINAVPIVSGDIFNLDWRLVRSSDGLVCFSSSSTLYFGSGPYTSTWTVGSTGTWNATNWDHFELRYGTASNRVPAGVVVTVTFDGAGIGPPPGACEYGTEKIEPLGTILEVTPGLIAEILPTPLAEWAVPLLFVSAGAVVALNTLCSGNPNTPQTIDEGDWTTFDSSSHTSVAVRKVAQNFQNTLWHRFCKCSGAPSGSPSPVDPPAVNWTQPTYYITHTTNNISNTDIAATLNLMLNFQAGGSIVNYYNTNTTNDIHGCVCPSYAHGPAHSGLTSSGTVAVSGLVGMEVEVTARPSTGPVLPGQPPYLWDMGWMSITNADGMLEEHRITRAAFVWLPAAMKLATAFTYTLNPGVQLRATELTSV